MKSSTQAKTGRKTAKNTAERIPICAEEKSLCSVCQLSTSYTGVLTLRAVVDDETCCPFCATQFEVKEAIPGAPHELHQLDNVQLMGAWSVFSDQLLQFHTNLAGNHRRARFDLEQVLASSQVLWACGSCFDFDKQAQAVELMWPVLIWGKILDLVEPSLCAVEALHLGPWQPETLREVLWRPEVARCWAPWLVANQERLGGFWNECGEEHEKQCRRFGQ
jgi:hypothetical protein